MKHIASCPLTSQRIHICVFVTITVTVTVSNSKKKKINDRILNQEKKQWHYNLTTTTHSISINRSIDKMKHHT